MEKIKEEHFECIKEDNSEEEKEKQWQRSKVVFDQFYEYLKNKGLNEKTAVRRTDQAVFFIMNYLFVYDDVTNILGVSEETIRKFLGNWYIRKSWNPSFKGIKSILMGISSFYTFLKDKGFISKRISRRLISSKRRFRTTKKWRSCISNQKMENQKESSKVEISMIAAK